MAKNVLMGLTSVKFGDLASDGGIATEFVDYGYTATDSCTFDQEDAEVTEVNAEEVDDPVYQIKKKGKVTISLELTAYDVDSLVALCGGKKSAGGVYEAPSTLSTIEKTIQITFKTGQVLTISRADIAAKLSGSVGKSDNMKISVSATALTPKKAGVALYTLSDPE